MHAPQGAAGAEWLRQDDPGGAPVSLPERIRTLRTEHSWSQGQLAEHIDAEQAQVSRYESGRAVPSLATIVRLAEAFGVCTDYLLVDDAPRRPFRSAEDALGDQLATIAELSDDDRAMLLSFLDALVTRTRLKRLTAS
jgi:transcriptional regulator with XRE-family HTH domain